MDTKESETTLFKVMRDLDAILPRNTSKSEINVNAGGVGVWIATTACIAMLVALLIAAPIGVGAYLAMQAEIKQLQNTDNAIRAYINTGKMPPAPEKK